MTERTSQGAPTRRRKPELIGVRVVPWDESSGLYGMLYEFDDGETFGERWGTREQTELAARVRALDIRPVPRPIVG
jgi:hypothetical protein